MHSNNDLYIDIILILYVFSTRLMWDDNKKGRVPRVHNKQIIIIRQLGKKDTMHCLYARKSEAT